MKLKGLQEWIEDIIATPVIELDVRYSWFDDQPSHQASDDIKALPFYIQERQYMHRVSRETLHRLHQKVREHGCECNLWNSVLCEIYEITSPDGQGGLPAAIAHDFIDRDLSGLLEHLSYSRHLEEVLYRLASLGGRAPTTLAVEFYSNPQRTTEEFAAVMEQYFPNREMMDTLWYRGTSSLEKLAVYETYVARHPEGERWKKSWLRRERSTVRHYEQFFPAPKGQWKHFYGTDTPEELVALARDPNTPDEILKELVEIRNAPFSTRISRNAERNLDARYPQEESDEYEAQD